MALVTSNTGITWVGALVEKYGEQFAKKVLEQDITAHSVSGRALLDLLIAGEHAIAPTILDSHVRKSRKMGAPVGWIPLEPVPCYIGQVMLPRYAPHPHAAMLFLDHDLSRQGGELYKANGYNSPRKDVPGERRYKKYYGPWSSKQVKQWSALFNRLVMNK
jgi:iron(III) transport system substrate-binding protein